jgi:hypothetical protein
MNIQFLFPSSEWHAPSTTTSTNNPTLQADLFSHKWHDMSFNNKYSQQHLQITSYLAQPTTNEITYKCVTLPPDGSHLASLKLKIPKATDKKRLGKAPRHRKWLPDWSTNSCALLIASCIWKSITSPKGISAQPWTELQGKVCRTNAGLAITPRCHTLE